MKIFKPASRSQDRPRLGGSNLARNERIESPKLPARKCRRRCLSAFLTRIGFSYDPKGSKHPAHFSPLPETLFGEGPGAGSNSIEPTAQLSDQPSNCPCASDTLPRLRAK